MTDCTHHTAPSRPIDEDYIKQSAAVIELLEKRALLLLAKLPAACRLNIETVYVPDSTPPGDGGVGWQMELNFPPPAQSGRVNLYDMTILVKADGWSVIGPGDSKYCGTSVDDAAAMATKIVAALPPGDSRTLPPIKCRWCPKRLPEKEMHAVTLARRKKTAWLCDDCHEIFMATIGAKPTPTSDVK